MERIRKLDDIDVMDCGEPLVDLSTVTAIRLRPAAGHRELVRLRRGVVDRIVAAQSLLPIDVRLLVLAGYRSPMAGPRYSASFPKALPHATGGEVDLTLCGPAGVELWLGSKVYRPDPIGSGSAIPSAVGARRHLIAYVLGRVGMVSHAGAWWHWAYGNRHWAMVTDAGAAHYGDIWSALP
jgi:D-alanyl-D-alanine dipeptidase